MKINYAAIEHDVHRMKRRPGPMPKGLRIKIQVTELNAGKARHLWSYVTSASYMEVMQAIQALPDFRAP